MLENLLSQDSFVMVNKTLIKEVGLHEAVLIGELFSEYKNWRDKGKLTDDGFFFSTRTNIEENTGLSPYQQRSAINKLIDLEMLEVKVEGLPATTYYRFNEENIIKVFNNKMLRNLTTSDKETTQLDDKKLNSSNNKYNNNYKNSKNNILDKSKILQKNSQPKSNSRKTKKDKCIDMIVSKMEEYTFTDKVKERILDFYSDRMEKNDYPATNQIIILMDTLSKVDEKEQLRLLDKSIMHGYRGVFLEDNKPKFKKKSGINLKDDYSNEPELEEQLFSF